ncbi:MAG: hypothetical protein HC796_00025 [Synechococcaceae cyanobacterium RL_1_2]|nr:hypothetical protein [Synechococcaceae cyanobacterium RL_1_2]
MLAIGGAAGMGFGTALLISTQSGKDVDIFQADQSFPSVGEWPIKRSY